MPQKASDQNGVLVIPNIQTSDTGNYVCMGADMFHMDEAMAVIIVKGRTYFVGLGKTFLENLLTECVLYCWFEFSFSVTTHQVLMLIVF